MLLLEVTLPSLIALVCYHYAKHRSKEKNIGSVTIKKQRKIIN